MKTTALALLIGRVVSIASNLRERYRRWRSSRPKLIASFYNAVNMAKVPEECTSHVIYAVLAPDKRSFRLTIVRLPEGYSCEPSCDGEPLPRDKWRCRHLVLCCENYRIEREWIATR